MYSAAQCRALDAAVIGDVGVPGIALMEVASKGVAEAIRRHHDAEARRGVVVVCGSGNNGGDGFAVARWLHGWGYPVRTWALGPSKGDAARMRAAWEKIGAVGEGIGDAGLVVDAIFGTGLDRPVSGVAADAIRGMDGRVVVAVDVPSGLHSDTGAVLGIAPRCVRTVTLGGWKPGLLAEPGADLAGSVELVDLGFGAAAAVMPIAEIPGDPDLRWPRRRPGDHKNRSGHLLLVAGSRNMAGAAVLAARGALAAGVGLLTVVVPEGAVPRLAAMPPEAMVLVAGPGDVLHDLPDDVVHGRTALAAGPGLGGGDALSPTLAAWLTASWEQLAMPVVYDADALSCAVGGGAGERVVTPHPGEAGRMLGIDAAAVQADRFRCARALADGRVALLKGRNTLVAGPGPISVNPTNSPVLGTGGSGDVLLGVIGALLARGTSGRDAARLAAYVHGRSAEMLERRRAQGWTAGDVADGIPDAIASLS